VTVELKAVLFCEFGLALRLGAVPTAPRLKPPQGIIGICTDHGQLVWPIVPDDDCTQASAR
jgi:hypothetical protein